MHQCAKQSRGEHRKNSIATEPLEASTIPDHGTPRSSDIREWARKYKLTLKKQHNERNRRKLELQQLALESFQAKSEEDGDYFNIMDEFEELEEMDYDYEDLDYHH